MNPGTSDAGTRPVTPTTEELARFYLALGVGTANARTADQLAELLCITGGSENRKRRVRLLAEHASHVWLIAAANDGYFRPETPAEMAGTIRRFESQIGRMRERVTRIKQQMVAEFTVEQMRLL